MENEQLIPADDFCFHYQVEQTFIHDLSDAGLIEIVTSEEKVFLHAEQLPQVEKFCRLHYELDINREGIEAIAHLLKKVDALEQELLRLRQQQKFFSRQNGFLQE